jgi:hypothetical protein
MAETADIKKGLAEPKEDELQGYYNKNREKEFSSKSFIEARDEINDIILSDLAGEQALEAVAKAEERITLLELQEKTIGLKDIAQKFSLKHQVSGFFDDDNIADLIKDLGESSLFRRQVKNFQVGELSRSLSTDKGHFIFRLLKKQESYIPELKDQIKENVRSDFIAHKSNEAAKLAAEKLLRDISDKVNSELQGKNDDDNIKSKLRLKWFLSLVNADPAGVRLGHTAFLRKDDDLTLVKPVHNDFSEELFKKQSGEFDILEDGGIYYLVQILDKRVPAAGSFEVEKDTIMSGLSSKKKDAFAKNWLQDIKKQVKWENYLNKKTEVSQ